MAPKAILWVPHIISFKPIPFSTKRFRPKWAPEGKLLGCIFTRSLQKQLFLDLHIIHFEPIAVLNKKVSSERGFLGEGSGDAFLPYRSKSDFLWTSI